MSEKLDLDEILAEFHAEQKAAPARPADAPAERPPRRAELHRESAAPEPAPRYEERRAEAPVAVAERPAPAKKPAPQPARRSPKAARRRKAGILRMSLAVLLLAALLTGLVVWALGEETKPAETEPTPVSLDLGEAMEGYLDEAPTRSRG